MTDEIRSLLEKTAANLEKNNMKCYIADTKEDILPIVRSLVKEGDTISSGGSMTLKETGVIDFLRNGSFLDVSLVQNEILDNYIADMAKYATNTDSVKIRACYNSIPAQLAKDNRKFQYKVVQKGGSASLFGASIEWLYLAGLSCFPLLAHELFVLLGKNGTQKPMEKFGRDAYESDRDQERAA